MNTLELVVSTPEGNMFQGEITKIFLRGAAGDLAVMANHIPFITSVKPCECRIELSDGTRKTLDLSGGLLSVGENKVTLMSGGAKWI